MAQLLWYTINYKYTDDEGYTWQMRYEIYRDASYNLENQGWNKNDNISTDNIQKMIQYLSDNEKLYTLDKFQSNSSILWHAINSGFSGYTQQAREQIYHRAYNDLREVGSERGGVDFLEDVLEYFDINRNLFTPGEETSESSSE